MATAKDAILDTMRELGLEVSSEFVPLSRSRNAGKKSPTLNWRVTLTKAGRPVLTTDYSAGSAHAPSYQRPATADSAAAVRYECEHGRPDREGWVGAKGRGPILPDPVDVLYSLVSDASVLDYPTFEAWAGAWDFDPDSRRAEGIYRECLELALRLRGAVGEEGVRKLAEATEGY